MKRRSFAISIVLLVLLAAGAACQFGQPNTPPSTNPTEPTNASAPGNVPDATAASSAPGKATDAAEKPAGGSGDFSLADFSMGLDNLTSYRQSLVLAFDGTVAGAETHSKTSVRRTVLRQPAAEITWIEIDAEPQQMYVRVGEVSYQQSGADGACSAQPAEPLSSDAPEVFQIHNLPAVSGASAAGEENVNGVLSMHYTFDESAIGRAGELKAKGDLWVAKDGGYVTKYSLSMTGEGDQLGPGVSGTQTWEYMLTEPNAVSTPDLPAGCAVGQVEDIAPITPDASSILRLPGFLQFSTPMAPEQAAQFYKDQSASLQWEEIPAEPVGDGDQILNYKLQGGGLVNIRLHKQEGGTQVTIQVLQSKP